MSRVRRPGLRSSAWIRPEKRHAIYVRDGHVCVWCGQVPDEYQLDHLFPRGHRLRARERRPNSTRWLVTSCRSCNSARQNLSVAAWLRRIRDQGFDLGPVLRRLTVARYVPINRRAGARALAAWRDAENAPPPPLPADCAFAVDGIPY